MTKYVFTMTAGRTGTAWLADLFAVNFNCTAKHEYLNFGEFGIYSQDVGLMGAFNHWGNKDRVQAFWRRKFGLIPETPMYVETNHALAKCGLIENLHMLPEDADVSIITMRRDWVNQAKSYLRRYDFQNMSTVWLWYLDMRYSNVIVPPERFANRGVLGQIIWYIAEVEARQTYYRKVFGDKYRFIDAKLETVTTQMGARSLLKHFGHDGPVHLPEQANANAKGLPPVDEWEIRAMVDRVKFNSERLVDNYLAAGRRLDVRPGTMATTA